MTKNTLENLIKQALKEAKKSNTKEGKEEDRYACNGKNCYKDAGGQFYSLADCKKECPYKDVNPPDGKKSNPKSPKRKTTYDCKNGKCTKVVGKGGVGKFATLQACLDSNCEERARPTKGKKKTTMSEAEMTAGAENTKFNIKVDVSNKQSETKLGIRIQLTPKEGMLEPDVRDKLEAVVMKKLNTSLGQYDIQVSKDTDVPNPEVIGFFIPLSQIKNMIVTAVKGPGSAPTAPTAPTASTTPTAPTKPTPTTPKPIDEQASPDENDIIDKLKSTLASWELATYKGGVEGCEKSNHYFEDIKDIVEDFEEDFSIDRPDVSNLDERLFKEMVGDNLILEMRQRTLNEISQIVIREDFYGFVNSGNNMLRSLEERGYDMRETKNYLKYLVKHNIM